MIVLLLGNVRLFSEKLENECGILKPCSFVMVGQEHVLFPNKCSNSLSGIDLVTIQELGGIKGLQLNLDSLKFVLFHGSTSMKRAVLNVGSG